MVTVNCCQSISIFRIKSADYQIIVHARHPTAQRQADQQAIQDTVHLPW
jgi:hypothetical protein